MALSRDGPSVANGQGDRRRGVPRGLGSWPALPHVSAARRQAVALTSAPSRADIERFVPSLILDITFVARVDLLSARVETSCPEVLIIDTDLLGLPGELCRMARSLRPDVVTVALVNRWSEREERLTGVVDVVLHKPPRWDEWQRLFGSLHERITRAIRADRQVRDVPGLRDDYVESEGRLANAGEGQRISGPSPGGDQS